MRAAPCMAARTASTTITAPSTTMPKSMAPSDIKLAETPAHRMQPRAKSSESGITLATTSPARRLPNRTMSTKTTMSPPSMRLRLTVLRARPTRSERLR